MSSLSALKVLIVDPAKGLRDTLTTALNGAGVFDLARVVDWRAAVSSASGRHLAFVDWDAGPDEAIRFVRQVRDRRAGAWNPRMPIVMVMGQPSAQAIQQIRDAGANEILLRPLTTAGVIDRLSRVVLKPRPFVDSPAYFGPERRRPAKAPFSGQRKRSSDGVVTLDC